MQLVNKGIGELPPGAALSDSDDNELKDVNDPHRALNIDLDIPLREDEQLPVSEHRSPNINIINDKSDKTVSKPEKVSKH